MHIRKYVCQEKRHSLQHKVFKLISASVNFEVIKHVKLEPDGASEEKKVSQLSHPSASFGCSKCNCNFFLYKIKQHGRKTS